MIMMVTIQKSKPLFRTLNGHILKHYKKIKVHYCYQAYLMSLLLFLSILIRLSGTIV